MIASKSSSNPDDGPTPFQLSPCTQAPTRTSGPSPLKKPLQPAHRGPPLTVRAQPGTSTVPPHRGPRFLTRRPGKNHRVTAKRNLSSSALTPVNPLTRPPRYRPSPTTQKQKNNPNNTSHPEPDFSAGPSKTIDPTGVHHEFFRGACEKQNKPKPTRDTRRTIGSEPRGLYSSPCPPF